MPEPKYVMSFVTGGLYRQEAPRIAELFLELGDWDAVREQVLAHNTLQTRTRSAAERTFRELRNRLSVLTPAQLLILVQGDRDEVLLTLWLAACKHYRFIREFAVEVVREKFMRLEFKLEQQDYEIFFNNKAEWHPELEKLTDSTRQKLRQVLFRMLRDAEIITKQREILPVSLPPRLTRALVEDEPGLIAIFPGADKETR